MLIKLVEDIERAIEHECYFSALALALTLPDICGVKNISAQYAQKKTLILEICPI